MRKHLMGFVIAAAVAGALTLSPSFAKADDDDDWHEHHHGRGWYKHHHQEYDAWGRPVVIYPAPPPVVYAPAPVYVPAPVYAVPAVPLLPPSLNVIVPLHFH